MKTLRLPFWISLVWCYLTALIVIALDQVTKVWLPARSLNQGVSFGVAAGWGGLPALSATLLACLFVWLSVMAWRQKWPVWGWVSLGALLGGGTSNVFDRLFSGAVRDPLQIPFTPIHNNLADYAIFLGVIGILGVVWQVTRKEQHAA